MSKFTVTHEFNGSEDAFWKLFFDRESNRRLHTEECGHSHDEVLEQNETDTAISRKVTVQPALNRPAPVTKLLGSDYRYVEEGQFNKAAKHWRARQIPSSLADKLRLEYLVRTEPIGPNKIRRVVEYEVEAKIFGIGGLMESSFETSARQELEMSAAFMNKQVGGA